jgi:molecular chaperone DnaK
VEVTFDVDANGILQVKAKDKTSGKEQSIRIEASSGLSDEDIKRMQQDAEAHADEDKKKMELIEAKNMADQMIHTAEKALKDAEGKISDDIKKEVTDAVEETKKARAGEDMDVLKKATESLSQKMMKIGEAMKTAQGAKEDVDVSSQQANDANNTSAAEPTPETPKDETQANN